MTKRPKGTTYIRRSRTAQAMSVAEFGGFASIPRPADRVACTGGGGGGGGWTQPHYDTPKKHCKPFGRIEEHDEGGPLWGEV